MDVIDQPIDARLGARVKALRLAAGLTLDALAGRAVVSRAMLSRVERGESSPTAQLLVRLCGGLGVTLSALFAAVEAPAGPLARRADQPLWRDPATGYLRRAVSPAGSGIGVDIVEVEFPGRADVTLDSRHFPGAGQHVWVLEGALEVGVGAELHHLATGDCLAMGFDRPIRFRNTSDHPVRYAVVVSQRGHAP